MAEFLRALHDGLRYRCDATAMSDDQGTLSRRDLAARVADMAAELSGLPQVIGLLGGNGTDWAVAQLAAWVAGKIVVPLPNFFSRLQLEHILRDAGVDHVVATPEAAALAASLGTGVTPVSKRRLSEIPVRSPGAGMIVYTSGSSGQPKGVRLGIEQISWQASALGAAIGATAKDRNLSVLPLALLLETITAICVPVLAGARTHFASAVAEGIGIGRPVDLAAAFERAQPTTAVLVPQLLSAWVAQLAAGDKRAPDSLRFVAVGGARISATLTERAWELGIPVHEGYGLTECCSVVTLNRPGRRKAATMGEPLPGLDVYIEDGEVVVSGPSVMDRYLHGEPAARSWRTGDLGSLDEDGFLSVAGRKDTLLVTSSGRNVSPEWIEAMLISDSRVAAAVVLGHGMDQLNALLVPSALGEAWLTESPRAHILMWLEQVCRDAPPYAVPRNFVVCPAAQAKQMYLLNTSNGRIVRSAALRAYPALMRARCPAAA
jgi:long-subunit acyl-CoA synthetase (AMP-forming)